VNCDNPLFSKDNNVILYSRYNNSAMHDFSANLEIISIEDKKISLLMIIFNTLFGIWYANKYE
jgi:hypothetical protein